MNKLTLTFDNGPDPACTKQVLDVLKERDVRATFFVCGLGNRLHPALPAKAEEGRRILERAVEEGHWVGNHSLTHTIELGTTRDANVVRREIGDNEALLGDLNEHRLFRPYMSGGLRSPRIFSPEAIQYLCDEKYTVVLFNNLPRDWEVREAWPAEAFRLGAGQDWSVLIVHDVDTYTSMNVLGDFLDEARERGVEIVQDFPPDPACVPIRNGEVVGDLEDILCGETPEEPHPIARMATEHVNEEA